MHSLVFMGGGGKYIELPELEELARAPGALVLVAIPTAFEDDEFFIGWGTDHGEGKGDGTTSNVAVSAHHARSRVIIYSKHVYTACIHVIITGFMQPVYIYSLCTYNIIYMLIIYSNYIHDYDVSTLSLMSGHGAVC